MIRIFFAINILLFSLFSFAATKIEYVTGQGFESSYCNANSGFFCLDDIKRRSESTAERDARWSCEMSKRGRALTYTASYYTYCNPSYLPPNHDGTYANCRSECRMQCEI